MSNKQILLDEYELSLWAFEYCRDAKDDPEIRKNITESGWAFMYCVDIKDDPEVRKNITHPEWACNYCTNIYDDPEIRKHIIGSNFEGKYRFRTSKDCKIE